MADDVYTPMSDDDDIYTQLAKIGVGQVTPAPSKRNRFDNFIEDSASRHEIDPDFVRSVIGQESTFKPGATSPKGASGLMQLMPGTARRMGVKNIYDPQQNIEGGTKYLKFLLDRFGGDVPKALAGYNAGEGAVDKYGKVPPYRETQDYVKKITGRYQGSGYASDPYTTLAKQGVANSGIDPYTAIARQGVQDAATVPQTPAQPVPESPDTLSQQVMSAININSPKSAVVTTDPDGHAFVANSMVANTLIPVPQPDGKVVWWSKAKAAKVGVTNPQQADAFIKVHGFAGLIGKVDDVGDNTGPGQPAVQTTAPDGTEVSSSIVKTPESAQTQSVVDQQAFPGSESKLVDSADVIKDRILKNASFEPIPTTTNDVSSLTPQPQPQIPLTGQPQAAQKAVVQGKAAVPQQSVAPVQAAPQAQRTQNVPVTHQPEVTAVPIDDLLKSKDIDRELFMRSIAPIAARNNIDADRVKAFADSLNGQYFKGEPYTKEELEYNKSKGHTVVHGNVEPETVSALLKFSGVTSTPDETAERQKAEALAAPTDEAYRQKAIDELTAEHKRTAGLSKLDAPQSSTETFPVTEDEIQNRIAEYKTQELSPEAKSRAYDVAQKNADIPGSFLSGLYGGAGSVIHTAAGVLRPFSAVGIPSGYESLSELGKEMQSVSQLRNAGKGSTNPGESIAGFLGESVPQLAEMVALPGGAIGKFAFLGAAKASGAGAPLREVGKGGVEGVITGGAFHAAEELKNPLARLGTVFGGSMVANLATGVPLNQSVHKSIINTMFQGVNDGVMRAGEAYRFWKSGEPVDVQLDDKGEVLLQPVNPNRHVDGEIVLDPKNEVYNQPKASFKGSTETTLQPAGIDPVAAEAEYQQSMTPRPPQDTKALNEEIAKSTADVAKDEANPPEAVTPQPDVVGKGGNVDVGETAPQDVVNTGVSLDQKGRDNPYADKLIAATDRLRKIEQKSEAFDKNALPGTAITGRSGITPSWSSKLNRQLDKTIDLAKEHIEAQQEVKRLQRSYDSFEKGDINAQGRSVTKPNPQADEIYRQRLNVGDQVSVGNNDVEIRRINKNSITDTKGNNWKFDEFSLPKEKLVELKSNLSSDLVEPPPAQPAKDSLAAEGQNRTKLDLLLDKVQPGQHEVSIDVEGYTSEQRQRVIDTAEDRGLNAAYDGRYVLVRDLKGQPLPKAQDEAAAGKGDVVTKILSDTAEHDTTADIAPHLKNVDPVQLSKDLIAEDEKRTKPEYPLSVRTFNDVKNQGFRTTYLSEDAVRKVHQQFPDGAIAKVDPWYTKFHGQSLDDIPAGKLRTKAIEASNQLNKQYIETLNDVHSLFLDKDIQLILDPDNPENIAAIKGNIRMGEDSKNRHKEVRLLDKIPPSIKDTVQKYQEYIRASAKLNEEYFNEQNQTSSNIDTRTPESSTELANPESNQGRADQTAEPETNAPKTPAAEPRPAVATEAGKAEQGSGDISRSSGTAERTVAIPKNEHPIDIYRRYFNDLNKGDFGLNLNDSTQRMEPFRRMTDAERAKVENYIRNLGKDDNYANVGEFFRQVRKILSSEPEQSATEKTPVATSDMSVGDRVQDKSGRRGTIYADKDGELHVEQAGTKARLPLSDKWQKTGAQIALDRQNARAEAKRAKLTAKGKTETNPLPYGPGAANVGDVPLGSSMKQLTKAVSEMPKSSDARQSIKDRLDLADKVTTGQGAITRGLVRMRALATGLSARPEVTDYKKALGDFLYKAQKSDHETRMFVKAIEKQIPSKLKQEAISNWIQAGGDPDVLRQRAEASKGRIKAGYDLARKLTDEEQTIARNIESYYEAQWQAGKEAGILNDMVENYVNHIVKKANPITNKLLADVQRGLLEPNFQFSKKKVFQNMFEGEQAGYRYLKPITEALSVYNQSFNRALFSRDFVRDLNKATAEDGRPLVEISGYGTKVPKGDEPTESYLIKPRSKTPDVGDYRVIDHPALRKWKWVQEIDGKPVFMEGDMLVHPEAYGHLKNVLGRSAFQNYAITRGIMKVQGTIKSALMSLSAFHVVQIGTHALGHRVNPFKAISEFKLDFDDPTQKLLVQRGLQVAHFDALQEFGEGLSGGNLINKIPILGTKIMKPWQEWMFQDYIPRIKMMMAKDTLKRNTARYKNLNQDQVAELTAQQSNAAFGELNYKYMGRNPTFQDALRSFMLAPDFFEARARFVGQAVKPFGREQLVALGLLAATQYVTARILNQLLDKDPHWKAEDAFRVHYNGRWYGLRTVPTDIMHLATSPRTFAYYRMSPLLQTGVIGVTGRDERGDKLDVVDQIKHFAQLPVPITFRKRSDQLWWEPFLNTMGVQEGQVRTDAQQVISDYYNDKFPGGFPKAADPKKTAEKKAVLEELRSGGEVDDAELERLTAEGIITNRDLNTDKDSVLSALQSKVKGMPLDTVLKVYEAGNAKEREEVKEILTGKLDRAQTKNKLTVDQAEQANKLLGLAKDDAYEGDPDTKRPSFSKYNKNADGIIDRTIGWAKAIGTDPVDAFDKLLKWETFKRMENGAIIVERMSRESSDAERKRQGGGGKEVKLDHTVPLELGGTNDPSNLKLVTTAEWTRYTPMENYLAGALHDGKIDKAKAKDLILNFKKGWIGEQDIIKQGGEPFNGNVPDASPAPGRIKLQPRKLAPPKFSFR